MSVQRQVFLSPLRFCILGAVLGLRTVTCILRLRRDCPGKRADTFPPERRYDQCSGSESCPCNHRELPNCAMITPHQARVQSRSV